jgi:hypothetical protein
MCFGEFLGWCGEQGRGIYVGGLMGFEGSGCGGDEEVDNGEDCAGGNLENIVGV